jgi:hypothetical protein
MIRKRGKFGERGSLLALLCSGQLSIQSKASFAFANVHILLVVFVAFAVLQVYGIATCRVLSFR